MSTAGWYWSPGPLRALGLRMVRVRRYGRRAWWLVCRTCGRSVLCLKCEDCSWTVEQFSTAAAHVKSLKILDTLFPFRCAAKCNSALCDTPPGVVLTAMLEDSAQANIQASPRLSRRSRKVTP